MVRLTEKSGRMSRGQLLAVVAAVTGIGYYIVASFASGSFVGFEAEGGALTCGAAVVSNSAASGGKVVIFNTCPPTPAPTPTPTPNGGIKAPLSGNMDRGGDWLNCIETSGQTPLPVTSCFNQQVPKESYLNAQTFEIDWRNIEPSQNSYNWQPIDDAISAVAGRGMRMRLKVEAGVYAPDWAKALGGAAVPFDNINTYLGGDQTVPRYWTSAFKSAYDSFMGAMAARYDNNPTVGEVEACGTALDSCESFLIFASDKTSDGVTNGKHLFDAGFNDALHMQSIQDDLNYMTSVWHKTRIILTVQPFHILGNCPGQCGDAGGNLHYTYDFIDGSHTPESVSGGSVNVTGLQVLSPSLAEFFHTGLGPKEVGGTGGQPQPDPNTVALYNYLYNASGTHNRSNRPYTVPLQTETYGLMSTAWASALNYACQMGATAVELPHGYTGWQKLSGSWAFNYPNAHTDTSPLSVLTDANACYIHNASSH
jgi:hypothetical protein